MSAHNIAQDGPSKPDFCPLYYLRIARGREAARPEDVIGYVAWDRSNWPFRRSSPFEWHTETLTLEVVAKERWMMQPRRYKSFEPFP